MMVELYDQVQRFTKPRKRTKFIYSRAEAGRWEAVLLQAALRMLSKKPAAALYIKKKRRSKRSSLWCG